MDGVTQGLGWVDWTLLAVVAVSLLVGVWRGLVFEVMALVGWLVAYVAAQWLGPLLAPHLPVGEPGSGLNAGAAFAVAFVVALLAWALLARLVRLLIHATPLTAIDRLLGGAFGLLRGAVVLLAVATLVAYTPAARSQAWTQSHGAAWLGTLLQGLKPLLPESLAQHLRT
jgi:membrane protein required for colicin V production